MLNQNHPDDERLSALAAEEADATADASLTSHLAACDRCTGLVNELGVLRASLAELPDLAPPRPLRLLPEVAAEPEGVGGWVRRLFAPVVTAGAALAMVGLVGTTAPALTGMAQQGDAAAPALEEAAQDDAGGAAPAGSVLELAPEAGDGQVLSATDDARALEGGEDFTDEDSTAERDQTEEATGLPAERSPWPMVLFTGIAVMIGAALLRWILLPRAG